MINLNLMKKLKKVDLGHSGPSYLCFCDGGLFVAAQYGS